MSAKIIIIGAGAAGIAAGTKLLEHGFRNLLILEAENRIGGRINTIPFASNVVDLGAQWCHGEVDNAVFGLASPHKLLDSATTKYDKFLFIKSDGSVVDQDKGDRLLAIAIETVENYKNELEGYRGSLGSFIVEKFQSILQQPEYKDLDGNLAQQFLDFFHRYENSIEASDTWFDASARGYLHYWDCDGDRLLNWKDRGYKTVLDLLMKKLPDPSQDVNLEQFIQFQKYVTCINWNRDTTEGNVKVTCHDGSSYLADHVIVTTSLGVLKEKYQTLFQPALPIPKKNAIQGLSIGTVDKLYLEFEQPFWPDGWQGFSLLWDQAGIDEVRAMKNSWLQDVFGFYIVDYQPNILCGWISGVNARRMEMTPEEDVKKGAMYLLRKFLKDMTVPDPIRVVRTQWYSNQNFRGSYSFRSIATELLNTSANDLAQPLYNSLGMPIVHFAGEATHDHYYSTVHGAIETGWREAKRIADLYSKDANTSINGDQKLNSNVTSQQPSITKVDVLILGAGLAGLGAAYQLVKAQNINFLILEAQDRVGGRLRSESMKSTTPLTSDSNVLINAGAQWLHGRKNELYKIAIEQDLLISDLSEEALGDYLESNGNVIDPYFVKKIDFKIGQILEECEKFAKEENLRNEDYPSSVEAYLTDEFNKYMNQMESSTDKQLAKELLDWHIRFQIIDNSCLSLKDVSAKSWGTYSFNSESCQAHINFKGTFFDVIQPIMKKIGLEKVQLNKTVEKICWGTVNFESYTDELNPDWKVLVKCSDGSVYQANQVVVTFSLGVLKEKADQLFHPNLPNIHKHVIDTLGFGTIDKIFLQFNEPWWQDAEGLQLIFTDELRDDAHWTRFISGFDLLKPGAANTLLGWVGGPGALKMEKLTDNEILKDCIDLLSKFTKKRVPWPQRFFITRWNSDEYTRGAYSYVSAASDRNCIKPEHLAQFVCYEHLNKFEPEPVDDISSKLKALTLSRSNKILVGTPAIIFAGECCHDKYYSTAHGAFHSGMEQAEELLKFYESK